MDVLTPDSTGPEQCGTGANSQSLEAMIDYDRILTFMIEKSSSVEG